MGRPTLNFTLAFLVIASATTVVGQPTTRPRILILNSSPLVQPNYLDLESGLTDVLRRDWGGRELLYHEYLDDQFSSPEHDRKIRDELKKRYVDRQMDVLVALGEDSRAFIERWHTDLWRDVPVVFARNVYNSPKITRPLPSGFAGVVLHAPVFETVDLALRLKPDTERVILPFGTSAMDLRIREMVREELAPLRNRVELVELNGFSNQQLAARLSELPDHSIVYAYAYFVDGAGEMLPPPDSLALLARAANAPIFVATKAQLNPHVTGGFIADYRLLGYELGALATRVLRREPVPPLTDVRLEVSPAVFDWRELQRWHIGTAELPTGAEVRFRTFTVWERYRRELVGIACAAALLALVILLLLVERRRRHANLGALRYAEAEARKTESFSQSVLALWPQPLAIISPEGIIARVNAAWSDAGCLRLGPLAGVEIGTNVLNHLDCAGTRDESAKRVRRALQSVLSGRTPEARFEYRHQSGPRDQNELYSELRVFRLESKDERVVVSITDVTEPRRADLSEARPLEDIAHSSRAAALGELAASLAHELNQPMTAILSNAQAARRFLSGGSIADIDEVRQALDDIVNDDKRGGEIISRMRTLLSKRDAVERSVFDMNEGVSDVARLAASAALLRRVKLTLDLAPQLPRVCADRIQVQQVVLNLVMNAIDAASTQTPERRVVRLETAVSNGEVNIVVRDQGPGIAEDLTARIFEPFFTTKEEGLGMGLAISRSIVTAHGGRIWVESSKEGATFYVAFPAFVTVADVERAERPALVTTGPRVISLASRRTQALPRSK